MPSGVPGYWPNETGPTLRPAMRAYLQREPLSDEQIAAIRAYLRQWIYAPGFVGPGVTVLRLTVESLFTRESIDDWIDKAVDEGVDPL